MLKAFADSLRRRVPLGHPVVVVALVVSLFIKEMPLKARQAPAEESRGRATPEEIAIVH